MLAVLPGPDGVPRCGWCVAHDDYVAYHDREWGFPVADDQRLFEKLCLEGFQSGLSWLTILRKRPAFRAAFYDFDIEKVAAMDHHDVARLLEDAAIIRHRGKIEASINNAARTLELQDEVGSLAAFVWRFEPAEQSPMAAQTPESVALSKALKQRGFTWTGPTTAYAFMQSMGLVNDHVSGCATRPEVESARTAFPRPI
jgi:DNA-3-methyladenine glycosylase I